MEGEKEGDKHPCVVASRMPPTGDLACNPGMCPDWELNCDPLVRRPTLSPLSYTSQGIVLLFVCLVFLHHLLIIGKLSETIC